MSHESPPEQKIAPTHEATFDLVEKGLDFETICEVRELKPSTISEHLQLLIRHGYDIDTDIIMTPEEYLQVDHAMRKLHKKKKPWHSIQLRALAELLPHLGFDKLKIAKANFIMQNPPGVDVA